MKDKDLHKIVEIGDSFEFCRLINNVSNVLFGDIIKIDIKNKTVDFKTKDKRIFKGVSDDYIRGLCWTDWEELNKRIKR